MSYSCAIKHSIPASQLQYLSVYAVHKCLFSFINTLISKLLVSLFLRPEVSQPHKEKILSTNACDAGRVGFVKKPVGGQSFWDRGAVILIHRVGLLQWGRQIQPWMQEQQLCPQQGLPAMNMTHAAWTKKLSIIVIMGLLNFTQIVFNLALNCWCRWWLHWSRSVGGRGHHLVSKKLESFECRRQSVSIRQASSYR